MAKVAFLINVFPPMNAAFVINLMLNALDSGYDIGIFPSVLNRTHDACQPEIIQKYNLADKVIEPAPLYSNKGDYLSWLFKTLMSGRQDLITNFMKSLNPFLFGRSWKKLFMFRKVIQFHESQKFDIYHCQFGNNGFSAAGMKELGLITGKIVTTFHGYDAHPDNRHLQNYYHASTPIWSRLVSKHSDRVTVNTPYLEEQVVELGIDPEKIELLPMGVDVSLFKPNQQPRDSAVVRLISVGRLVKWKSHALGIQAVSNLVQDGIKIEYRIIGSGDQESNLRQQIKDLQLDGHVKLLGHKSQLEIKKCMQASDIFLMTSTCDEIGRRETQGVVSAEAQACGLPVVAFRSGGVPYTIDEGKTGLLAEEKNVTEFTNHIRKLITDEGLRKDMGSAAREFVERNFSLSRLAQKQLSLYEKILHQ